MMKKYNFIILILISFYFSCTELKTCEDFRQFDMTQKGSFKIDTVYLNMRIRSYVMESNDHQQIKFHGNQLYFFPEKGDSIYKELGKIEFVLTKKDSTYVQLWSCKEDAPKVIKRWKNNTK